MLGRPLDDAPAGAGDDEAPLAPGMLASHYAPRARLRLEATRIKPGEALLAFGPATTAGRNAMRRAQPVRHAAT